MIREYIPSDLPLVLDLFGRSVRELAGRDYSAAQISVWAPQPPNAAAWAKRLSSGVTFVYIRGARLAGFFRMENKAYLDLLYVHPEFQRQGIGRALFQRVLTWASSQGSTHLTSDVSITARPFFENMGFRVVESQTIERQGIQLLNFKMTLGISAQQVAVAEAVTKWPPR
jgi:putative acetyltransferase